MFKLVEERRAWQPVTFPGLTEEGERVENRIEMLFVLLSTDANAALLREAGELARGEVPPEADGAGERTAAAELSQSQIMARFGLKVIRDWKDVQEANGDPIRFSEEALARLFNVPGTFEAALTAYREAAAGGKDARAGN